MHGLPNTESVVRGNAVLTFQPSTGSLKTGFVVASGSNATPGAAAARQALDVQGRSLCTGATAVLPNSIVYGGVGYGLGSTLATGIHLSNNTAVNQVLLDCNRAAVTGKKVGLSFGCTDTVGSGKLGPSIEAVAQDMNAVLQNLEFRTTTVGGGGGVTRTPFTITALNGYCGVGTTQPIELLDVNGVAKALSTMLPCTGTSGTPVWVNSAAGGAANNHWYLYGTLRFYFTSAGALITVSDRALKTNIQPLAGSLAKIRQLAPSSYETAGHATKGLIAQEVFTVFPESVTVGCPSPCADRPEPHPWAVSYSEVYVEHLSATQELAAIVDAQGRRLAAQESELAKTQKQLASLGERLQVVEKQGV